jgi:ubiquinone/menaquinone biosynthesis C-methylase UbiE
MKRIFFFLAYVPTKIYGLYAEPKNALIFLFGLQKRITTLISTRASDYDKGIHPKHRLMQYHLFFTERMKPNETVIDIGSGNGFLAFDMAKAGANVTGIELSKKNFDKAQKLFHNPKLTFVHGDALKSLPGESFDTAVMSNVLEHIEDRIGFLKKVQTTLKPKRWLIRVPCFDRDWQVPLVKELGLDSRLDETHFTEFTVDSFKKETTSAGLKIVYLEVRWGEIWAELVPLQS